MQFDPSSSSVVDTSIQLFMLDKNTVHPHQPPPQPQKKIPHHPPSFTCFPFPRIWLLKFDCWVFFCQSFPFFYPGTANHPYCILADYIVSLHMYSFSKNFGFSLYNVMITSSGGLFQRRRCQRE